jgi:hypothetical protein
MEESGTASVAGPALCCVEEPTLLMIHFWQGLASCLGITKLPDLLLLIVAGSNNTNGRRDVTGTTR